MEDFGNESIENKMISIEINDKDSLHSIYMPFIKNGGLFIADHTEYDLGDEVFIHLNLMDESEKIRIEGKVIWLANEGVKSPHRPGVGIQFSESEDLANDKIETYLAGYLSSSDPTLTM